MTVRKKIEKESGIFFITITCYKWLPLFEKTDAYSSVFNWFEALKRDGNEIVAFVIMPHHLHVLVHFTNTLKSVNEQVSNGKRFMAYDIVKRLTERNLDSLLKELEQGVNNTQRKLKKKHEVFEPSFESKRCMSNTFTLQKLNYIHKNPVVGKWMLVANADEYKYSSLKQYETGKTGIYPVTPLQQIESFSFL